MRALTIQEEKVISLLLIEVVVKLVLVLKGEKEKWSLSQSSINDLITLIIMWSQQIHSKTENAPFLGHWNKQQRGVST
jgi:hypothetical protein